ncbi:hypothetical protein GFL89_24475 [Rhizobium leguminosarum bv. viciae]|nr:hypothetical protein [Rhizobium leguminosarum bv. viciae]
MILDRANTVSVIRHSVQFLHPYLKASAESSPTGHKRRWFLPPTYPGMPRWVKISGIIVGVIILLAVVLIVSGVGGPHGPGRHLSPPDTGSQRPSAGDR